LIIKKTCLEKQLVHPGGKTTAFSLALPQFFLLFAKGLGKPLSKASSGQASDG
jgi:hypothetical protein